MHVSAPLMPLESIWATTFPELSVAWAAAEPPAPRLLALNAGLATELGLDGDALASEEGVALLTGVAPPAGATPVAQAYAGHQFGGYAPRLGDGRALLLGELRTPEGELRDVHLKGSGRTPFARGGDGKAVVGPMLREYLIAEAMHALRVPTTRALAVVGTGERVMREGPQPGGLLVRVARSHLRVGSFQYARATGELGLLRRLADHAIDRHHPRARRAEDPYLALFEAVVDRQAALVARWMLLGFVHGVMNTDNMTISGETIDYGPCAFIDVHDPAAVFSSIDQGGRYAYGNQPVIAQWDLARLAEGLLPLIDADADTAIEAATSVLETFPARYAEHWLAHARPKLGLATARDGDGELATAFFEVLRSGRADHTGALRALSAAVRGDEGPVRAELTDPSRFDAWAPRWRERLAQEDRPAEEAAATMDAVNPSVIPRNHLVEEALTAATGGDMAPFEALLAAVTDPFADRDDRYTEPAPDAFTAGYQTFCGT